MTRLLYITLLLQVIRISTSQSTQCVNIQDFEFNYGGDPFVCDQIAAEERRRTKLCQEESVRENCPFSCGICCDDDPVYTFRSKSRPDKSCLWLGEREIRQFKYCGKLDQNGQKISAACPKSCNTCKEYIPDDIPEYLLNMELPEIEDTTSVPSQSPAPTVVTCKDRETFRHKDKLTCREIRRDEYKRGKFCKNQNVRNACPVTCGLCCVNDDSYTFLSGSGQTYDCDFLEGSEFRRLKFCDTSHDGQMVKNACRSACNNCLSRILPYKVTETGNTNRSPDGGAPPAVVAGQQKDEIIKTKVPAYLILSLTFLTVGLLIGIYSVYISQKDKKKRREKRQLEESSEPEQNYVDRYLSHSMSTAEPDAISVALSKEGTGEINNSTSYNTELHMIPEDSDDEDSPGAPYHLTYSKASKLGESSYVAASVTKLGKKNVSQADVHKCTNFPCDICTNNNGITFIKAPRANIERGPYGEIQFVPVPVNFVSQDLTEGISPSDSLSVTSGLSSGMSIGTHSNTSTGDNTGTSQTAGIKSIANEKKTKGITNQDATSHSSMLLNESEV